MAIEIKNDQKIPKDVYQLCTDKRTLSLTIRANMRLMADNNPDYAFHLYDDDEKLDLLFNYNKDLYAAYCKINPKYGAARADFFRYIWLHRSGGIYLDQKSTLTKPLKDVIKPADRYILSQWDNHGNDANYPLWGTEHNNVIPLRHGEFLQWCIISEPKHIFLENVIKMVVKNIYDYDPAKNGVGRTSVFYVTGPVAYTHAILLTLKNKNLYRLSNITKKEGILYSIFKNPHAHWGMIDRHYSSLAEPLILP
jgi:mannosyltransferase OCH1-like enzyme